MTDNIDIPSELAAAHAAMKPALASAAAAARALLLEPGGTAVEAQCEAVATLVRQVRLYMFVEEELVFEAAMGAGVSRRLLAQLRAEHDTVRTMLAGLQPMLRERRSANDTEAVSLLRVVQRMERHIHDEERLLSGPDPNRG